MGTDVKTFENSLAAATFEKGKHLPFLPRLSFATVTRDCHNHSQQSVTSFGHKMDSPVAPDRGRCPGNEQRSLVLGASEGSPPTNWWEVHGGGSSF
jgi:hypothetical protein